MDRPQGYSLIGYGSMIEDHPRIMAYVAALRQAVRPGSVVLDIGAGTGIFSLLSIQFGAAHVHAVEPNDAIRVARTIAEANGYSDRITFHQTISTEINLPAPADVIISDLRGVLPLLEHHIPSIVDARQGHLADGGHLIPQCDTIWAALVDSAESYQQYQRPWVSNDLGLDMRAGHRLVVNTWRRVDLTADRLIVPPQRWATLDYRTVDSPHVDAKLTWTAECPGTAHGVLVWFDTQLLDGIGFSNAPGEPKLIYGQAFFPLQQPIDLAVGEQVAVRLAANLVAREYVWRWETEVFSVTASSSARRSPPERRLRFQQSTFLGNPLGVEKLHRSEAGYVPRLSADGQIDRYLLSLIDGRLSLGEIARQAAEKFPKQFPRWQDALTRAAELADRFGK